MKPALVLGLALAANAMVPDSAENNELFVAPTGKLGDHIQRFPGKIIMYDEVADDELYHGNLPREAFRSDEEYRRYIVKRSAEEADDEFLVRPLAPHISADDEFFSRTRGLFKTESEWRNYIASTQPPAVKPKKVVHDDELAMRNPTLEQYHLLYKSAEEADNELLTLAYLPRGHFKTEEEWQKYQAYSKSKGSVNGLSPNKLVAYDDELWAETADDELAVKLPNIPRPDIKFEGEIAEKWRKQFGPNSRPIDLEAKLRERFGPAYKSYMNPSWAAHDDELRLKVVHRPAAAEHLAYAFDDDELVAVKIPREKFPTEEAYRRYQVSLSEEVTDDELLVSYQSGQHAGTIRIPSWEIQVKDDEFTDDELLTSNQSGPIKQPDPHVSEIRIHHWDMRRRDDKVADDELAFRAPRVFIDRHLGRPDKNTTSEDRSHVVKPAKNSIFEALFRDDEADDELLYLGQLIKDQVPRHFGGFDDDEFRAKGDKPAHVKIQEMGTEGPKIKRKLRPVVDGAQN